VANITRNWRFVANYSYTDFIRTNVGAEIATWYGIKKVDGRLVQGAGQDATGRYIVDASAFEPGKTVAKWIELGGLRPQANLSTLQTTGGVSIAQPVYGVRFQGRPAKGFHGRRRLALAQCERNRCGFQG
jgi:hypothetical protein